MTQKRRGILALAAGVGIAAIRGADEAAVLLAKGADDLVTGAGKGSDEAASKGDELTVKARRYYRRKRLESLIRDVRTTESFSLPGGYYAGFHFEPGHRARLDYEFETKLGQSIDAFLFTDSEFGRYETDGEVDLFENGQIHNRSSGERTTELDRDEEYWLIFDNTGAGVATEAEFDVTVSTDVRLAVL